MIGSVYFFQLPNSPMRYWIVLPSSTVAVSVVCRHALPVSPVSVMTGAVVSTTVTSQVAEETVPSSFCEPTYTVRMFSPTFSDAVLTVQMKSREYPGEM